MILIDMNQVLISNLLSQLSYDKGMEVNDDLIRHMALSTLLSYKKKYSSEYGELVLCCDDKNYWRKDIFPFYKSVRKAMRDASKHDWNKIFNSLNKIRDEIGENFPYRLMRVEKVEADDIIATICKDSQENYISNNLIGSPKKILIVSSDKDFLQLQKYENVEQYSPIMKKFLHTDSPEGYLIEHVIKGDSGDGVPNVLSDDDTFANETKRQTPLTKKKLEYINEQYTKGFTDMGLKRNFDRNMSVINLSAIPEFVEEKILAEFRKPLHNINRSKLTKYFFENNLKFLFNNIDEF
jgi:hypothetical protein